MKSDEEKDIELLAEAIQEVFDNEIPQEIANDIKHDAYPKIECSIALNALATLRSQMQGSKWISVEDRLPEEMQDVIFTNIDIKDMSGNLMKPTVLCGFYRLNYFHSWLDTRDRFSPTHWQPLPEPPASLTKY